MGSSFLDKYETYIRPFFRILVVLALLVYVTVSTFLYVLFYWVTGSFGGTAFAFFGLWALLMGIVWWRRRRRSPSGGLGKLPFAIAVIFLLMPFIGSWMRDTVNADRMVAYLFAQVRPVAMLVFPLAVRDDHVKYDILKIVAEGSFTPEQKRTVYREAMKDDDRGTDPSICMKLLDLGPEAAPLLPDFRRQLRVGTKNPALAAEVLLAMNVRDQEVIAEYLAAVAKVPPPSFPSDDILNKRFLEMLDKFGPKATKDAVPVLIERFIQRKYFSKEETALLLQVVKIDPAASRAIVPKLSGKFKSPIFDTDLDFLEILAVVDPDAARKALGDLNSPQEKRQQLLTAAGKSRLEQIARGLGSQ